MTGKDLKRWSGCSGLVLMMRNGSVWASALVLLLAGCLGDADLDPQQDDDARRGVAQGALHDDTTGAIEGTVASDLFEPLRAEVLLFGEDRTEVLRETTADPQGAFAFTHLEPGTYALQATHTGYQSHILGAEVAPGQSTKVDFRMSLLPSDDPFIIQKDVRGIIHTYSYRVEVPTQGCIVEQNPVQFPPIPGTIGTCGGGFIPFVPWENARGVVDDVDDETETILVEMAWEPAGMVGENLRLVVRCSEANTTDHPCWFEGDQMTSPVTIRADRDDAAFNMSQTWTWHVLPGWGMLGTYPTLGIDIGASYEQTFTVHMNVFQRAPAPEGYSGLPES